MPNQQFETELYKPIIKKFKKIKLYSSFKDNIWGADLADMQLISKCNKENKYLLCTIDLFSKYAWFVPIKDKKRVNIIVNAFQTILGSLKRKPKIYIYIYIYGFIQAVNFITVFLKNC